MWILSPQISLLINWPVHNSLPPTEYPKFILKLWHKFLELANTHIRGSVSQESHRFRHYLQKVTRLLKGCSESYKCNIFPSEKREGVHRTKQVTHLILLPYYKGQLREMHRTRHGRKHNFPSIATITSTCTPLGSFSYLCFHPKVCGGLTTWARLLTSTDHWWQNSIPIYSHLHGGWSVELWTPSFKSNTLK